MSENTVTIRIKRYLPEQNPKPYWQDFKMDYTGDTTVLDALERIKAEQDSSLTFRRSCRHAICGSCAMMVNRRNRLVCDLSLASVIEKGRVMIEPLPYIPVIKDLVVDRSVFWEHYEYVQPWLRHEGTPPEKEFRMSPEEVKALEDAEKCIMCGACFSSCPVVAGTRSYIGPHALLKLYMRVQDPRDSHPEERLDRVSNDRGVYRCHTVLNCVQACPKGLDPAKAIAVLAKMSMRAKKTQQEREERQKGLGEATQI